MRGSEAFRLFLALCACPASAGPVSPFALVVLHAGDNGAFAAADIDGDGRTDIVTAREPRALRWLAYPDLESHPIEASGNLWMEIQAADVDGDGDPDVLAPDMGDSMVYWWENPGPAAVRAADGWVRHRIGGWDGGFPHDFKTGDLDGDGRVDAVLRPKASRTFWIFRQDAPAVWSIRRLALAAGEGEGTAVGDLDGDGRMDITDGLIWLEAPADPVRGAWKTHAFNAGYGCPLTRAAIADLDGDGRADIVVAPSDTSLPLPVLWFGTPDPRAGPWASHRIMPPQRARWMHSLQVGDVDRDGHPDVVTGSDHRGGKEMLLFRNQDRGKGDAWEEIAWPTAYGVWQAVLADVDGNGYPDILSADDDNGARQELWLNPGDWGGSALRPRPGRRFRNGPIARLGPPEFPAAGKIYAAVGRRRPAGRARAGGEGGKAPPSAPADR
jgi:hypothetical protein